MMMGTLPEHAAARVAWALADHEKRAAAVDQWTRDMQRPGRAGVIATVNCCEFMPRMIRTAFHLSAPEAFAAALLTLWTGGAIRLVILAGDADTLARWLARARLTEPPAFLRPHVLHRSELPDHIVLYRGGTLGSDELAAGRSWTRHRDTAGYYARWREQEHGGAPIILRTEVTAEQVSLVTRTRESEWVVLAPERVETDTTDRRTIGRMARRAEARCVAPLDTERLRLRLDSEEGWHGWPT